MQKSATLVWIVQRGEMSRYLSGANISEPHTVANYQLMRPGVGYAFHDAQKNTVVALQ